MVAASVSSSLFPRVAQGQVSRFVRIRDDRFGRIFPDLPPFFRENTARLQAALREIGKPGGIMDAKDQLGDGGEQAAIDLIANAALNVNNPNNLAQTAGTTFMGQFIDHDLTFDQTSALGVATEPANSPNTRDPRFDLDSVYGDGPRENLELYQPPRRRDEHPTKLRIESTDSSGHFEDVPRKSDGTAIIADPRNDENMIIQGLQAAFILFHNNAVDLIESEDRRASQEEVFEKARELTRWHYQWIVVHEILPLFIGQAAADDIFSNGRQFYRPAGNVPQIPVEFQGAAYRMGHTLVRPSYRANLGGDDANSPGGAAFFGMIFDPSGEGQADPVDLRGGARARRRFIGWQTFFDFGPQFTDAPGNPNPAIRPNKQVDATISTPLFHLPIQAIAGGTPGDIISLPQRNLLRGVTWSLPSGQSIARKIGAPVLNAGNDPFLAQVQAISDSFDRRLDLGNSTPLWAYVLNEGLRLGNEGRHLGPVGGRIVGEVFIGLLQLDDESYLNAPRRWRPTLPQRNGRVTGDFKMVDFLTFAGVAPDGPLRGKKAGGGLPA
ncbi:MAG TPA: peroxidase family protein [Methylomirabilota bacterium]|nr:peroxidase family protein [Methylomirabilota bacterium]